MSTAGCRRRAWAKAMVRTMAKTMARTMVRPFWRLRIQLMPADGHDAVRHDGHDERQRLGALHVRLKINFPCRKGQGGRGAGREGVWQGLWRTSVRRLGAARRHLMLALALKRYVFLHEVTHLPCERGPGWSLWAVCPKTPRRLASVTASEPSPGGCGRALLAVWSRRGLF